MICESWIAFQKKLINKTELQQITEILRTVFSPTAIPKGFFKNIISVIQNDKKNNNSKLLFALVNGIGRNKIDVPVTEIQIKKALEFYNEFVK
jgi:3-dehydroquinate synthase